MPALTETGAGQNMLKAKISEAFDSYKSDQRTSVLAKQVKRSRDEKRVSREQQMADMRKQVLLELIYVHAVQGMPLDAVATRLYTPQELALVQQMAGGIQPAPTMQGASPQAQMAMQQPQPAPGLPGAMPPGPMPLATPPQQGAF